MTPKYLRPVDSKEMARSIGLSGLDGDGGDLHARMMLNRSTIQVGQRMHACADIPRTTAFETPTESLVVRRGEEWVVDDMHDEQMLICDTEAGISVLVGCSHPGIINCLIQAKALFPGRPIHTVMGGMHLEGADEDRLVQTIAYFRQQDIARIVPLHCTGQGVIWRMRQELGEQVQIQSTGDEIDF